MRFCIILCMQIYILHVKRCVNVIYLCNYTIHILPEFMRVPEYQLKSVHPTLSIKKKNFIFRSFTQNSNQTNAAVSTGACFEKWIVPPFFSFRTRAGASLTLRPAEITRNPRQKAGKAIPTVKPISRCWRKIMLSSPQCAYGYFGTVIAHGIILSSCNSPGHTPTFRISQFTLIYRCLLKKFISLRK